MEYCRQDKKMLGDRSYLFCIIEDIWSVYKKLVFYSCKLGKIINFETSYPTPFYSGKHCLCE